MASFRVHEDQENRRLMDQGNNRVKMAGNGNNGQQPAKRTVLGVIDNRMDVIAKAKQVGGRGKNLRDECKRFLCV